MGVCIVCQDASKNTGKPLGSETFGPVEGMFIVPLKSSAGVLFELDSTIPLDQAQFDLYTNDPDVSKRLLPIMGLEEPNFARAENLTRTFASTRKENLGKGVLSATVIMPGVQSQYVGQLQASGQCGKVGAYFVDNCGNVRGDARSPGVLRPIPLADNTWSAILMWAVAGASSESANITFDVASTIEDGDFGFITKDSYTADVQNAEGMKDIVVTITAATASDDTILFNVKDIFGNHFDLEGIPGISAPDITLIVNAIGTTFLTLDDLGGGNYSGVTTVDMLVTEPISLTVVKTGLASATGLFTAAA